MTRSRHSLVIVAAITLHACSPAPRSEPWYAEYCNDDMSVAVFQHAEEFSFDSIIIFGPTDHGIIGFLNPEAAPGCRADVQFAEHDWDRHRLSELKSDADTQSLWVEQRAFGVRISGRGVWRRTENARPESFIEVVQLSGAEIAEVPKPSLDLVIEWSPPAPEPRTTGPE